MADASEAPRASDDSVGASGVGPIAELYLGNLLYALERCALSLEDEGKPADAAFYRGIARKLAEAHGRQSRSAAP